MLKMLFNMDASVLVLRYYQCPLFPPAASFKDPDSPTRLGGKGRLYVKKLV